MARKIALATLLLTVVALVWNGFLHLVLLRGFEEPARRLFRRELPFALSIALTVAILLLFVLGYTRFRRKGGVGEGAQYGFFFGILAGVLVDANQYVLYPIPATIALVWFIGGVIEFTVYGVIASTMLVPKTASGEQLERSESGGVRHRMAEIEVRPSDIEGLGIFALRPFRPGETIAQIHVVREITEEAPLRPELGERIEHCAYPDGRVVLVAWPERQVNHSCDPNAWEAFEGKNSSLVARRDVAAGDEITIDYNVNIAGGTSWPCHCGAQRCRGVVAGDFFLLPVEWQHEYRPLLAEWFVRRQKPRVDALDAALV